MIFGAHVIVYSNDATPDRAFFRDVLGFSHVDAGHDWLTFALPPGSWRVVLGTGEGSAPGFVATSTQVVGAGGLLVLMAAIP